MAAVLQRVCLNLKKNSNVPMYDEIDCNIKPWLLTSFWFLKKIPLDYTKYIMEIHVKERLQSV